MIISSKHRQHKMWGLAKLKAVYVEWKCLKRKQRETLWFKVAESASFLRTNCESATQKERMRSLFRHLMNTCHHTCRTGEKGGSKITRHDNKPTSKQKQMKPVTFLSESGTRLVIFLLLHQIFCVMIISAQSRPRQSTEA